MLLDYLVWQNLEASGTESLLFYSTIAVQYDFIPLAESRIQLHKRGNKQPLQLNYLKKWLVDATLHIQSMFQKRSASHIQTKG